MNPSAPECPDVGEQWWNAFWNRLQQPAEAAPLKAAAIGVDLKAWTSNLTAIVVQSCHDKGWQAAAKGFPLSLLPQSGQEYLGIDVLAFGSSGSTSDGQKAGAFRSLRLNWKTAAVTTASRIHFGRYCVSACRCG